MNAEHAYIVFTDLKGFSKLTEPEVVVFYDKLLQELSSEIIHLEANSEVWNTWGDALVAIFKDERHVVELILKYRDFFRNYNFSENNISQELLPRIACHFGRFELFDDPLLNGRKNALGSNINTSARIEPITRPNEIYVTKDFKDQMEKSHYFTGMNIAFDELGEIPLAKNFGSFDLFRLRKTSEKEKIIDRITKKDLSYMLPEAESMSEEEKKSIEYYKNSPSPDILLSSINLGKLTSDEVINENFLYEIANLCKNFGLYNEALLIVEKIERQVRDIDGVNINLFKYKKSLMKLKTNCLTRVGKYEEASNLIYGVWQLNHKDSDTLSMLAAQYKRRALYDENGLVSCEEINSELLNRSLSLYIEAFRLNIEDYYPAINIAYLYKIIGGVESGRGTKLAQFIIDTWGNKNKNDWWIDTTLLECEIILDDFEDLLKKFQEIIEQHNPNYFEKKSTFVQIETYAKLMNKESELNEILKLFKGES